MSWIIHFHVNLAEPPGIPGETLKYFQPRADMGQFAGLKDSRYSPSVICHHDCVSDAQLFLPRVVFIDDDIVIVLKRTTADKAEAATHSVKLGEINAC